MDDTRNALLPMTAAVRRAAEAFAAFGAAAAAAFGEWQPTDIPGIQRQVLDLIDQDDEPNA